MLILTRRKDESILIGDNIKIKILDVQNNNVKIGIEAPKELTILREELVLEVQRENQRAVQIDLNILGEASKLLIKSNKKEKEI
ncbi:MAG: carbon storage regulator CsrA [Halanaerobiales bacterium]|nr:carbon storage regulator CsrA [Halanaerobiales bacterium]